MTFLPAIIYNNHTYVFNPYFGALVCYQQYEQRADGHVESYKYVENPYLLKPRIRKRDNPSPSIGIKLYAFVLTYLCKHFFLLARLFLYIRIPIYKDAGEANQQFYAIFPHARQRELCMPRAIFTASLSKRFKHHGALFIGAFLPTTQLHAWIVEDGMHADINDTIWIQYQPIFEFEWKRK